MDINLLEIADVELSLRKSTDPVEKERLTVLLEDLNDRLDDYLDLDSKQRPVMKFRNIENY